MNSHFRIVVVFTGLSILGLLCLNRLKVTILPVSPAKRISISFNVPENSPEQTELQVTSLLENALSQIREVKNISSQSTKNSGRIDMFFQKNVNLEIKRFEVISIIRQVRYKLPENATYPLVSGEGGNDSGLSPILTYIVNADDASYIVKQKAELVLKKRLAQIPEIKSIVFTGNNDLEVVVSVKKLLLEQHRISPSDIVRAIDNSRQVDYLGSTNDDFLKRQFLKLDASENNLNTISDILIRTAKSNVRIRDIANIYFDEKPPTSYFRVNGKNAVHINIYAKPNSNVIILARNVRKAIDCAIPELPAGYKIGLIKDDTEYLNQELYKNYRHIGFSMLILTLFAVIAYRSKRHFFNLFFTLLVNLSLTILLVATFGIEVHVYSIAGFCIAFGLIMDHAIIMIDYYDQFRNRQVVCALVGATAVTVAAVLGVFLLPGEDKKNLIDFALVIAIALTSSVVTNLGFTVALYNVLNPGNSSKTKLEIRRRRSRLKKINFYLIFLTHISNYKKTTLLLIIILFGMPINLIPKRIDGCRAFNMFMASETYQQKVKPKLDFYLGGAINRFIEASGESTFIDGLGRTKLFVNATLANGNTLEQMNSIMSQMEGYLQKIKGVDQYFCSIASPLSATLEITFNRELEAGGLPHVVRSALTSRALDLDGVKWSIYGVGNGFSNGANQELPNYRIKLKGYNFDELERQSNLLVKKLLNNGRVQNANSNDRSSNEEGITFEYNTTLDYKKAGILGIEPNVLFNYLSEISKPAGTYTMVRLNDNLYPLIVKADISSSFTKWDLMNIHVTLKNDKTANFGSFGKLGAQKTNNIIYKENRQYTRVVTFDYAGNSEFGDEFLEATLESIRSEMPLGYSAQNLGSSSQNEQDPTFIKYGIILLIILSCYLICCILFGNLTQALYIIITVPTSYIGLFLGFNISGFPFDQGIQAAFVLITGLVVSSSIFIINDFNALRIVNPKVLIHGRLLVKALCNRARTIVLTIAATIFGLIPFIWEGSGEKFWFSLAFGTVSGLIFMPLAIFVVLPAFLIKKTSTSNKPKK